MLVYSRNPGDARVDVGSGREFASRSTRPNRSIGEIGDPSLSLSLSLFIIIIIMIMIMIINNDNDNDNDND